MSNEAAREVEPEVAPAAPAERGWWKLILALAAFLVLPSTPQLRALLPIDQTVLLFVPVVAACALVGWWAGGRPFLAIAWVALAALLLGTAATPAGAFSSLIRGWSLLLAGAFGLICLFGDHRPLFARALASIALTLGLAGIMTLAGPMSTSRVTKTIGDELARRNAATSDMMDQAIKAYPDEWKDLTTKFPELVDLPAQTTKGLGQLSEAGKAIFPALLALESLAALALGWATYHRLGRARLGAPLRPLREFRFNDQLVWGLIVGLVVVLLPTLSTVTAFGENLLVFFGALYAVRGLGVLSWFTRPGSLGVTMLVGFLMLWAPVLNAIAFIGFAMLGVTSLALGLGDTWADWRSRARPVA